MFDFLKNILKKKKPEEEAKEQIPVPIPEQAEKKEEKRISIPGLSKERLAEIQREVEEDLSEEKPRVEELLPKVLKEHEKRKKEKEEEAKQPKQIIEKKPEVKPIQIEEKKQEKVGFFESISQFISDVKLTDKSFENLFSDLEINLLQNNVAVEVVDKIRDHLRYEIVGKSIKRSEVGDKVKTSLSYLVTSIFEKPGPVNLVTIAKQKKPVVVLFIGVNGVGKTTAMAKVGKWLQNNKLSCVFAASDTFRAAAIEQLEKHADNLGIKIIKHNYGADSAAVAFDAIEHAKAKGIDFVLIDTAGRSHANTDLMSELEKIKRVTKPDLTILVVDSLTGNDAAEQARNFNQKIGIDCSILTKTDTDDKGGAVVSVAFITQKPILFLGTGQRYEDLKPFNTEEYVEKII